MGMRSAMRLAVVCALLILPGASIAGGRYDGDWVTHLACEAHGETPAYKFLFPSTIKDGNFHGQHGEEGGPGYLVIDGKIADEGTGTRNEGAGILGRSCTFEFVKQPAAGPEGAPDSSKPAEPPAAKPDEPK